MMGWNRRVSLGSVAVLTAFGTVGVSGCRPVARSEAASRALKIGPGLERLDGKLFGSQLSEAEKQAYWSEHQGKLVSATGNVVRVTEDRSILLRCPLKAPVGRMVLVQAYVGEDLHTALPMMKSNQYLTLQGLLSEWNPDAEAPKSETPAFVLRKARIRIR